MDISEFAKETSGKSPYLFEMNKENSTGKCIFSKDNSCIIYLQRPIICRFYPFELVPHKKEAYSFKVTDECPGVFRSKKGCLDENFFSMLFEIANHELKES